MITGKHTTFVTMHDGTTTPFEPSPVLPIQLVYSRALTAEQQLCLAVLQNAIDDLHQWRGAVDRHRLRPNVAEYWTWQVREVEHWFRSNADSHPFYFVPICQVLDYDPSYVRRVLAELPPAERCRRFSHRVRPGRAGRTTDDVGHW